MRAARTTPDNAMHPNRNGAAFIINLSGGRAGPGVRPTGDRFSGELMRSQKEKMLGGELYDPLDPQLSAERRRARLLFKALNDTVVS